MNTGLTGTSSLISRLTEELSELVWGLLRHNVSLAVVAVEIEGMLRRDGPSGGGEGSRSRVSQSDRGLEVDSLEVENPPDHNFT